MHGYLKIKPAEGLQASGDLPRLSILQLKSRPIPRVVSV